MSSPKKPIKTLRIESKYSADVIIIIIIEIFVIVLKIVYTFQMVFQNSIDHYILLCTIVEIRKDLQTLCLLQQKLDISHRLSIFQVSCSLQSYCIVYTNLVLKRSAALLTAQ